MSTDDPEFPGGWVPDDDGTAGGTPSPPPPPPPWWKRPPVLAVTAVLVALTLGGIIVALPHHNDGGGGSSSAPSSGSSPESSSPPGSSSASESSSSSKPPTKPSNADFFAKAAAICSAHGPAIQRDLSALNAPQLGALPVRTGDTSALASDFGALIDDLRALGNPPVDTGSYALGLEDWKQALSAEPGQYAGLHGQLQPGGQ